MQSFISKRDAVTFVELLVAMSVVVILAGIAIYAINPNRQYSQARNTERWAEVNTILNSVQQRMADNRGTWNTTCGASTVTLPAATTTIGSDPANINLAACLIPVYLPNMPLDPSGGVATSTGYTVFKDANGRITVAAPSAELGEYISVIR